MNRSTEEAMPTTILAHVDNEDDTQTTADATPIEREGRQDTTTNMHGPKSNRLTFVLRTHDGDGYVLPCLSWEATKLQIEEIYSLRGRERLAKAVKDGNFSLLTESGDIILPSFWDLVVKSSTIVQVSLPSDVLDPDVASFHPRGDRVRTRYRTSSPSVMYIDDDAKKSTAEELSGAVDHSEDDSSGSDEGTDVENTSSESELSETPILAEATIEPIRPVIASVDGDGNDLSFQINTAFIGPLDRATADINNPPNKREPQQSIGEKEYMYITKAVMTQVESRNTLQIHVLPGPRSTSARSDISLRWYHLHSESLDFVKFRETCLGIPGISERLHKLSRKLFEKIEKEKLKDFLDGMFIEPGTVLRADESHQSDPQSAIFSCVPYFDLHKAPRKASAAGHTDHLFPPRTLMQSYYPYEPVQERDAEQAYRTYGNERAGALIHVPNLWMVNIGSELVATCGHQALSKGFVQSIQVVEVGRKYAKEEEYPTTDIRLTDWHGRNLIYSLKECRSYFQMEQKLKELRWCSTRSQNEKSLQLSWQTSRGSVKVTPGIWADILRKKDALFINLSLLNDIEDGTKHVTSAELPSSTVLSATPFFHWPNSMSAEKLETERFIPGDIKRSMQCLEHVEKAMLSEVLSSYGTYNSVEKTFTSTAYYRALPEGFAEQVKSSIESIVTTRKKLPSSSAIDHSVHEAVVNRQQDVLAQKTTELFETMQKTLALFVADVEKSTMLRKSWGAMKSMCGIVATVCSRAPSNYRPRRNSNPGWTHDPMNNTGWFVRLETTNMETKDSFKKLQQMIEMCRKCGTTKMYNTQQAALLHLQKHIKSIDQSILDMLIPEECILTYAQMKMETWNDGYVAILTKACQTAQEIHVQTKELSEGVCNEDGQLSDLYTFPRPLLSALRQLLVFYLAVERAMYYTEEQFMDKTIAFEEPEYMATLPFSSEGLRVLEVFGNGVQQAVNLARNELCSMVKSTKLTQVFQRLSQSPEYLCSWFMRRLIVKPLEKSMTVSDMYREYLSTIQFQVNHRPGKRLLRSINLLQEELTALLEVNTQQYKLISNYLSVLDDATYEKDTPSRRAMYPYERMLLASCQDNLQLTDQEYRYLLARCGPLADSTKQSLEINEEDHGKAIMVFTIVTIVFLPLSFVTSFLGMNTTDIRDMGSSSSLFWAIAVPLTAVTMGSILYIGYNGDELRDTFSSLYRTVTGKQDRSISARGISIAQRKRARRVAVNSNSTLDSTGLADEAEYANPRPDDYQRIVYRTDGVHYGEEEYPSARRPPHRQYTLEAPTMQWEPYLSAPNPFAPEPRMTSRTQPFGQSQTYVQASYPPPPPPRRYQSPPPLAQMRPTQEYAEIPVIRQDLQHSEFLQQGRAPAQYLWTKKGHRYRRSHREEIGQRIEGRRDEWDDNDKEEWYTRTQPRSRR
ncbi:uncharacterized protein EKO05_0005542 [Ascochyta rabiei]|uniref:uncharacterized protein n=1 Tax=Didymella rabiei TaxID=5454 RepID=UPI0021FC4951|nr:uncharacterized protein EKO05_0005542 [Ascochyta rabiei]UPX15079.1 hypothetical protein EKO05_0005542 [Ascochyta rabiei]